jgi:hypothetical protein
VVIPRFQTPGTKEDGTSQTQTDDEMMIARSYEESPNWQPKLSVSMKFLPVTVTVLKLPSAKIDGYTDVRPIGGWNLNCKPDSMVSLLSKTTEISETPAWSGSRSLGVVQIATDGDLTRASACNRVEDERL